MTSRPTRAACALLTALSLALAACGGGSATPSTPGVVTTPTPAPSATPAVSVSPSPSASPSASPSPSIPIGTSGSCAAGPGTLDSQCGRGVSQLDQNVEAAIEKLAKDHPEIFDVNDQQGPGGYYVKDPEAYYAGVVTNLLLQGLCANFDGAEIQVKRTNDFSEQYDILTSNNHARRAPGSYRSTCSPAVFPVDPAEFISYVRVGFYGFKCPAGVTVPGNGLGLLPKGCTGYVTATAKKADGRDVDSRLVGSEIRWFVHEGPEFITVRDWPDQAFNKYVDGEAEGKFMLCAVIRGVQGCLTGTVTPAQ
jgi:hypothetical protein